MITSPSFNELSKGELNRYELTMATAKAARLVTEEYVKQRDAIELRKQANMNREGEKVSYDNYMDNRYRDERAVRVAVDKLFANEMTIHLNSNAQEEIETAVEA